MGQGYNDWLTTILQYLGVSVVFSVGHVFDNPYQEYIHYPHLLGLQPYSFVERSNKSIEPNIMETLAYAI